MGPNYPNPSAEVSHLTRTDFVTGKTYQVIHGEAYCLMTYVCENPECGSRELLWNSRDGVTPFMIPCQLCGSIMQHIDWRKDMFVPSYKPHVGQRVFRDVTREEARENALKLCEQSLNTAYPIPKEQWEQIATDMADDCDGEPCIIVWSETDTVESKLEEAVSERKASESEEIKEKPKKTMRDALGKGKRKQFPW